MTQTSPKPAPQNATNSRDQYSINALVESQAPVEANQILPPQQAVQDAEAIKPFELEGVQKVRQGNLRGQRRGLSLRAKATALAIAIGTIPVLAIGTINYFLSSKDIREDAIETQEDLAISIRDETGRFMFERYGDIKVFTALPFLNNPKGTAGVKPQQKQAALDKIQKASDVYDSIAVADLAGNTILQTTSEPITGLGKGDYFKEVLKTKQPVVTPPRKSNTSGEYVIFVAAPIFDANTGEMISVVRTRIPIAHLDGILQREEGKLVESDASFTGVHYHLIGPDDKVFAASEKEQLGENARLDIPVFAQMKAAKKVASREGFDESDPDKQLITYAPVEQRSGMPELNWSVVLHKDKAIVLAAQHKLLLSLMLGTGLSALIVGAIAAYLANRATRPIEAAAGAVEKLGQGELDTRIAVQGKDELAMLGSNINLMADQLQNREQALLQNQEAQAEQSRFFANIAFSRVLDFEDIELVFNKALKGSRKILNVDRMVIYRFNSDWSGYIAAESVVPGWPQAIADKIEDPCIGQHIIEAYKKGRVVPTNNVFEAGFHPDHLNLMKRLQIKANLVTPILKDGQLFGLLIAHHCGSPHGWQQSEINFLRQLASQLGYILDRVTFLEEQKTAKEQLQKRALELMMEVEPISKGDLTIRASVTEDEIGTVADSYNATVGSLRKIVTQVQTTAKLVATTTSTSEASVQELSTEALRQTEEIAAALDRIQEMSNSIRAVATNAEQAEAAVQQATQTVEEGDAAMNRTVDGILAIRETVAQTSKKVKRLGESSQKISKVVNLIGNFADQTNLLALNAAIEAAHAGEQGRGFAVVADKVRTLARQSAQATIEIESLVKDIQTETNEVVAAMEAGTEQVVTGTKLVDETRQSLNKIAATSVQISALVQAIASATVAQSQASESVTQTMSDVAAIASKTSNEATVVSASFKELLAVSQELQASAGQFKVS